MIDCSIHHCLEKGSLLSHTCNKGFLNRFVNHLEIQVLLENEIRACRSQFDDVERFRFATKHTKEPPATFGRVQIALVAKPALDALGAKANGGNGVQTGNFQHGGNVDMRYLAHVFNLNPVLEVPNVVRKRSHSVHEGLDVGADGREITVHADITVQNASGIQLLGNGFKAGGIGDGIRRGLIGKSYADAGHHEKRRPEQKRQ